MNIINSVIDYLNKHEHVQITIDDTLIRKFKTTTDFYQFIYDRYVIGGKLPFFMLYTIGESENSSNYSIYFFRSLRYKTINELRTIVNSMNCRIKLIDIEAVTRIHRYKSNCDNPTCNKKYDFICGSCGFGKYCSKECKKAHWKNHRQTCNEFMSAIEEINTAADRISYTFNELGLSKDVVRMMKKVKLEDDFINYVKKLSMRSDDYEEFISFKNWYKGVKKYEIGESSESIESSKSNETNSQFIYKYAMLIHVLKHEDEHELVSNILAADDFVNKNKKRINRLTRALSLS